VLCGVNDKGGWWLLHSRVIQGRAMQWEGKAAPGGDMGASCAAGNKLYGVYDSGRNGQLPEPESRLSQGMCNIGSNTGSSR